MGYIFAQLPNKLNIKAISNWNLCNVAKNMSNMFYGSCAVGDIVNLSNWNVKNVIDMDKMFCHSAVVGDIIALKNWDVSNVKNMIFMFLDDNISANITGISRWNIENVADTDFTFTGSKIKGVINVIDKYIAEKIIDIYVENKILGMTFGYIKTGSWKINYATRTKYMEASNNLTVVKSSLTLSPYSVCLDFIFRAFIPTTFILLCILPLIYTIVYPQ